VLRVTDVDAPAAAPVAWGPQWFVEFRADNTTYHIAAERLADGDHFVVRREAPVNPAGTPLTLGTMMATVATATGVVDPVANEVRITAPLSAFGPRAMRRGAWLERVTAYGAVGAGSTQAGDATVETPVKDTVLSSRPFVVGTATCVRVGR
jgi:hypothetical protein